MRNFVISRRGSKIRTLIIYFIIFILLEYLLRKIFFEKSLTIITILQKNLSLLIPIEEGFSLFGSDKIFISLIFIFFNIFNIYKTFLLISIWSIGSFLIGFLKMVYLQPRPYWLNKEITPYLCEGGWGNPSGHAINCTAFYLTVWRLIFSAEEYKKYPNVKHIGLVLTLIFLTLIYFSRLLLGQHTINQIIFGALIGLGIYYTMFYIIKPDPNNANELFSIINLDTSVYLISGLLFLILTFLNYLTIDKYDTRRLEYKKIIHDECPWIGNCIRLDNDALLNCLAVYIILPTIMGIKSEFNLVYKRNFKSWVRENFARFHTGENFEHLIIDDEEMPAMPVVPGPPGLTGEIVDFQWNHTPVGVTLIRILVTLCFLCMCYVPYYVVSCNDTMLNVVLVKFMIPCILGFYLVFSYFKKILFSIKLTN
jgi:membrane-associated phospholipid phosphatase